MVGKLVGKSKRLVEELVVNARVDSGLSGAVMVLNVGFIVGFLDVGFLVVGLNVVSL